MTMITTSGMALRQISGYKRKSLADLIEAVVANAMRSGAKDMTMREVQQALVTKYARSVDMSSISGRVSELIEAKRMVRDKTVTRVCTVSGYTVHPLTVPPQQVRMF